MSVIEELPLVSTIAVGLSLAFVCGFIASKLRLSPLVGYIAAGVLVGPFTPGFVADLHIAEQLSEIGVVLLLFGVGLHFSLEDFAEVRKIATFGALIRIVLVTALSAALAMFWGWPLDSALLYGLALSVASTVVLLRALEEHHLVNTITGKIAISWLVVEDIAMVLAMVMIPALADPAIQNAEGGNAVIATQLLTAFGKVGLFAAIMVIVGKRVLPWLLTAVSRTGSRELFTLAAISMAMGIAFAAAMLFDVSLALGAFFAGMMIRESDLNHEVADRVLPFQDAFAVLFFVAVGMLFDPAVLLERPLEVAATLFIIIVVKAIITFGIVTAFKYPLRKALVVSVGLSQIGEFSFILLTLGASLGLLPEGSRDIILGGALISIMLNPILMNTCLRWIRTHGYDAPAVEDKLAHMEVEECKNLKNLILIIGFGRVGAHAASMLDPAQVDLVIVDNNREKVAQLRNKGFHAIAGDATQNEILIDAQIAKAHAVLITLPDPFDARRVVEQVKNIKPDARIFVRSHNDEETRFFETQNVALSVSGTEEIARRMVGALYSQ